MSARRMLLSAKVNDSPELSHSLCDSLAFDVAGGANKLQGLPAAKIIARLFSFCTPRRQIRFFGLSQPADLWRRARSLSQGSLFIIGINLVFATAADCAHERRDDELVTSISCIIAQIAERVILKRK